MERDLKRHVYQFIYSSASLSMAYIKSMDIGIGVHLNVNRCRQEHELSLEHLFGGNIEAVKRACELLEMQHATMPACITGELCVRVFVPPSTTPMWSGWS